MAEEDLVNLKHDVGVPMASRLAGPSPIFLFESAKDRLKNLAVGSFTDNERSVGAISRLQNLNDEDLYRSLASTHWSR